MKNTSRLNNAACEGATRASKTQFSSGPLAPAGLTTPATKTAIITATRIRLSTQSRLSRLQCARDASPQH